ncbi:hypothetical protein [Bacteroides sp. 519]|uniref:hypothetical protein n=1 Tax=Bacteroides sp. 519 TaxID=2302937 RepID=UPI0013D464BA|nr:hypothetical protein [Bacteroides sp. 519]NDV59087.1 hypothetical protein [Bacteroides sp. 519]
MPTFIITSKAPRDNKIPMDKGTTVEVQLPFGQLPFGSIASKEKVIEAFKCQKGVDISSIYMHGGYFSWKKI